MWSRSRDVGLRVLEQVGVVLLGWGIWVRDSGVLNQKDGCVKPGLRFPSMLNPCDPARSVSTPEQP